MPKVSAYLIVSKSTAEIVNRILWDGESPIGLADDVECILDVRDGSNIGDKYTPTAVDQ